MAINGLLGNPRENLNAIEHRAKQAKQAESDLALFPELVVHGHCSPDTWYQAEPVPNGPSTERLCRISRDLDLFLSVGLSEKENDIVYNTQVLTGPNGFIGAQRKLHMSRDEALFYTGAKQVLPAALPGARLRERLFRGGLQPGGQGRVRRHLSKGQRKPTASRGRLRDLRSSRRRRGANRRNVHSRRNAPRRPGSRETIGSAEQTELRAAASKARTVQGNQ